MLLKRSTRSLRSGVAFLIAATGLGLCGYAALQWRELPSYSEDDLRASTELNLAVDLARRGAGNPLDDAATDALRKDIRREVEADINSQRQAMLSWLISGLALIGFATLSALIGRRSR